MVERRRNHDLLAVVQLVFRLCQPDGVAQDRTVEKLLALALRESRVGYRHHVPGGIRAVVPGYERHRSRTPSVSLGRLSQYRAWTVSGTRAQRRDPVLSAAIQVPPP